MRVFLSFFVVSYVVGIGTLIELSRGLCATSLSPVKLLDNVLQHLSVWRPDIRVLNVSDVFDNELMAAGSGVTTQ